MVENGFRNVHGGLARAHRVRRWIPEVFYRKERGEAWV